MKTYCIHIYTTIGGVITYSISEDGVEIYTTSQYKFIVEKMEQLLEATA